MKGLKTRVLKYKVPNFKMLNDAYKERYRGKASNTAQNSAANVSTVRQSEERIRSPGNHYGQREMMMRTQDLSKSSMSNSGVAPRSNLRSQNVSKRSNLYRDIWNKTTVMPASNHQMIDLRALQGENSRSIGFDVAKSTQQGKKDSVDGP